MAEDDGIKPEDQEGTNDNSNVQTGSEDDAVILDELTSLQNTDDMQMGGQMQGRENAGGGVDVREDMAFMSSVHRGGFSTEQEVMDGIVPPQDDQFKNKEDVVADDEDTNLDIPEVEFDDSGNRNFGGEEVRTNLDDQAEESAREKRADIVQQASEPALGDPDDNAITPSVGTLDVDSEIVVDSAEEEVEPPVVIEEELIPDPDPEPLPPIEDIVDVPEDGPTPGDPIVIYEADLVKLIGPFDDARINAEYLNTDSYLGDGSNGTENAGQILLNGVPVEVTYDAQGYRIWTINTGFEHQDSDIQVSVTIIRGDDEQTTDPHTYNYDVDNILADDTGSVSWNETVDLNVLDNDTIQDNNIDYANGEKADASEITKIAGEDAEVGKPIDLIVDGQKVATLTLNADGTINYNPDTRVEGTYSFEYEVTDDNGETTTATASVSVDGNDIPIAVDDSASGMEDQPVIIKISDLLSNDSDLDGDTLTLSEFTQPAHGTLVDNGDGTLTFTPDANWNGETEFSYSITDGHGGTDTAKVTIDIDGVNDLPVAVDDFTSGTEDHPVIIKISDLLFNDSDLDGDTLTLSEFTQPAHGTVVDNGDGTLTFTPDADWNGETDFIYTISDGHGATDTAKVTIDIDGVNDGPVAVDDSVSGKEDQTVTIKISDLLSNDSDLDGDSLSLADFTQPDHGTLVDNGDGTLTFTPDENWNGETEFSYAITDGHGGIDTAKVTIDIDGVNDGPVGVDDSFSGDEDQPVIIKISDLLANDSDLDGDSLSLSSFTQPAHGEIVDNGDGTLTFTPDADWNGDTQFIYVLTDGNGGFDTAKVTIDVDGVNDAPVAVDDSASGTEDQPVIIKIADLLTNDSDLDGDTLTMSEFTQPAHGTLVDNGDGTLTFTPDENWNGETEFSYSISDGHGGTDTAKVTIDIDGVNDAPVALDDFASGVEDQPIIIQISDLLSNDSDLDGDTLTLSEFTQPAHGTIVDNHDGTLTFTPDADWNGETDFIYTISDGNGDTDTAKVTIDVDGVNDAPVALTESIEATEDGAAVSGQLDASDVDGDTLSY
ncbi:MAG: cadherin-like domain-containing protein, partial [Methylocystaceae bacterium]|nr:cadherin-like domain-containing protein [Methylocystaceae bacterium]